MRIRNLSLTVRVLGLLMIGLIVLAGATSYVVEKVFRNYAERIVAERQDSNLRVAWDVMRQYGVPFRLNGDKLMAGERDLAGFFEPIDRIKALAGGVATVFKGDTRLITNVQDARGNRLVGTKLDRGSVYEAVLEKGQPYRGEAAIQGKQYFAAYDPIKDDTGKVIGILFVGVGEAEYFDQLRETQWMLFGASSVIVLLVGLVCFVVIRRLMRPLSELERIMVRLAGGDRDFTLPWSSQRDEIGAMARAVEVFRTNAEEVERLAADQAENRRRAEADRRTQMEGFANDFESSVLAMVATLGSTTEQLQSNAQRMKTIANSSSARAQSVSSASQEANANVAAVAEANDTMMAASAEESRKIAESSRMARNAVELVTQTNRTVEGLANSAQTIGEVVSLIQSIAGQTNLLALNATIEAARAGEAGKGFAVVAGEVKSLANQTAKATEDISLQIEEIRSVTGNAVTAIGNIGRAVTAIDRIVAEIAGTAEEREGVNRSISARVRVAAEETLTVSHSIADVTAAAADTEVMASEVLGATGGLKEQASTLRTKASEFIARVRGA
jgi:methyl-accepting chemotaxis protein